MKILYKDVPIRPEAIEILRRHIAPTYGAVDVQVRVSVNCIAREMRAHDTVFVSMVIDHTVLRHLRTDHTGVRMEDGESHVNYRVCDIRDRPAAQQAKALIRHFDTIVANSGEAAETIESDLAQIDPAVLAHLADLSVRIDWCSGNSYSIGIRWMGLSEANRPAARHVNINQWHGIKAGLVKKAVIKLAREQADASKGCRRDLTMDHVLHATLIRLGADVEGFVGAVIDRHTRQIAQCGTPGDGPIEMAGMRFFWKIYKGHVSAKYELAKGITWAGNSLVLRGAQLPETILSSMPGQPIERMILHEDIRGYEIVNCVQIENAKGGFTTTMQTRSTMPPVAVTNRTLPLAA